MANKQKNDRVIRWSLVGACAGCVIGGITGVISGAVTGHPAMENPVGGAAVGAMRGLTNGLVFGLPIGAIAGIIASYLFPGMKIMQEDGDGPVTRIYGDNSEHAETPSEAPAKSGTTDRPDVSETSTTQTEEK